MSNFIDLTGQKCGLTVDKIFSKLNLKTGEFL